MIYYILNPTDDLKDTENSLKPLLETDLKLKGIYGKEPSKKEFNLKLLNMLIYCGHSNGNKYFDLNYLKYDHIKYLTLLMGCSSVKIDNYLSRRDDPVDITSYYQINKW